jgi:protein-disulfide isomerase
MKLNRSGGYKSDGGSGWFVLVSLIIILSIILFGARNKIKEQLHSVLALDNKEIEEIVANYIRENPKALIDSVEAWGRKQEQEREKQVQEKLKETKDNLAKTKDDIAPFMGNKDGDLTVVTFFDYRCGYCKKSHKEMLEFIKKDPKVKIYLKEMPILGPQSLELAKLALATYIVDKDKFLDFHSALLETNQFDEQTIDAILTKLGLDKKKVRETAKTAKVQEAIDSTRQLAAELNIMGTPAFIFDEQIIRGGIDANSMIAKANEIRQQKKGN